jgi:hypothetical protein
MMVRNVLVTATRATRLAQLAGWTRVAFGAAFVVAPKITARPWAGSGIDTAGAQLLTRSMGVRDLLLGVGLLHALNRDDKRAASINRRVRRDGAD